MCFSNILSLILASAIITFYFTFQSFNTCATFYNHYQEWKPICFCSKRFKLFRYSPSQPPFKKEEKEEDMKSTNTIHLKMFKRDKKNVSSFHYKSSKEMYFFHVIFVNSIGYKRGMCGRILEIFIINWFILVFITFYRYQYNFNMFKKVLELNIICYLESGKGFLPVL